MMQYLPHHHADTGFSLVETLVAVAILLVVIVGPMSIATQANSSTTFANEQVIAYFLAQEGLELVQKGRDDLLLDAFSSDTNNAWNIFVSDSGPYGECLRGNTCGLEMNDNVNDSLVVKPCSNSSECQLYLSSETRRAMYTYDAVASDGTANEPTLYSRSINIRPNGDEALVTVDVRWRSGDQIAPQSVTATTYLFNVYGR
jgi:prepilin-type N-terminal cleavage/methylation domain-containing protein